MDKDQIFALVVRCTREVLPKLEDHEFAVQDSLQLLGANSLDRAEILIAVLESMCLHIPRVELFGPRNIGELVEVLHEKLHRA
jgi:polyketide biosynthesis acyl carrier protein